LRFSRGNTHESTIGPAFLSQAHRDIDRGWRHHIAMLGTTKSLAMPIAMKFWRAKSPA